MLYFTLSNMNMIEINIKNQNLKFETSGKVFSPHSIDPGTLAMLDCIELNAGDKVLDLGCGYGVVGILAAKIASPENVYMCDSSEDAINLSKTNSTLNNVDGVKIFLSDGLKNIAENNFTIIASNPPYHEDFKIPKAFIEKGYMSLAPGGKMYMVTKRKTWYKMKFISVFGGVKITEINGYFVFMAEKKLIGNAAGSSAYRNGGLGNKNKTSKKLARKIKKREK